MIFRGIHEIFEFLNFFGLRDLGVFYLQKSAGTIGPMPQGEG
jgi:hypothetical protein